ncbi:MAG: DEAD/DEAH box helicase [Agrobacterium sp.]|nr:DEAD/DEAH box helicase [Agrobacterium sp.]
MTDRSTALSLLRRALGDNAASFRDGQWEAIDALVNRRERLLVVQRTGWGKSSVYFIATRILRDRGRGPTLIVSPLLALMRNQIQAASRLGIRALTINSTNRNEWPALQQVVRANQADALLISPERLANDDFVENVLLPIAETIGLLVVDEAHCISDWGHDFRPDYRRLVNVLQRMPERRSQYWVRQRRPTIASLRMFKHNWATLESSAEHSHGKHSRYRRYASPRRQRVSRGWWNISMNFRAQVSFTR